MSEYIEIETELDEEEPHKIYFYTNLPLSQHPDGERYAEYDALEEGSPLAQALVIVDGIVSCIIDAKDITIVHEPNVSPHAIIADVSAAIKDFFL